MIDYDFEVLINEYKELSNLRERSIKNTEESTRTYVTFIGFVITATALLKEGSNIINNKIILVFIILLATIVGKNIYHSIISSNINQTIYSKELNLTRKYLSDKCKLKNKIFLPTNENEPKFDNLGFIGEYFSKSGSLSLIRKINSLLIGILVFLIFNLIPIATSYWIFLLLKISVGVIGYIIAVVLHNSHHQNMVCLGEKIWCEISSKMQR